MNLLEKIQAAIIHLEGETLTPCSLHLSGADEIEFYKLLRNINPKITSIEIYLGLRISCHNSVYSYITVVEGDRNFDINNNYEEIL